MSVIRNDWEYPTTEVKNHDLMLPTREPVAYCSREYGQSDLDSDNSPGRRTKRKSNNDPYKFENPDAIGNSIAERKRKRRKTAQEEMAWNEGLRLWEQRRNAWTGAVKTKPSKTTSATDGRNMSESTSGSRSWPVSLNSPAVPESSSTESVETADTGEGPWLPIFPPMMNEDNPMRQRIKPAAYPAIYSKVVVQSLTPNVPIPLNHMINALVDGWKAEGNWPPQLGAVPSEDAKKGRKSSAFLKWRKEQEDQGGTKSIMRKGIGAVKKALGAGHDPLRELGIEFQDDQLQDEDLTLNKGLL